MKVSKQSWHYRWLTHIGFRIPGNLCKYFWKTVWSMLLFPLAGIVALALFVFATSPIWVFFTDSLDVRVIANFAGFLEIAILSIALGNIVSDRKRAESYAKYGYHGKPKSPSLVKEWAKAKKDKVCPMIEIVE